jgi:hypothetical protein
MQERTNVDQKVCATESDIGPCEILRVWGLWIISTRNVTIFSKVLSERRDK